MYRNVRSDESELLRYDFTPEELTEKAKEIAVQISAMEDLDREKKSVAADYTSKEKHMALIVRDLSRAITDGYDMRRMPCHCFKDFESGYVYYYTYEQLEGFDLEAIMDEYETVEDMVNWLQDESGGNILPVKKRAVRDSERQAELPLDSAGADEVVDVEGGEVDEELETVNGVDDLADEQTESEALDEDMANVIRDDRELRKALIKVLVKAPTLKTIGAYTDAEWYEANRWAVILESSKNMEGQVFVPEKPAFLGKAK